MYFYNFCKEDDSAMTLLEELNAGQNTAEKAGLSVQEISGLSPNDLNRLAKEKPVKYGEPYPTSSTKSEVSTTSTKKDKKSASKVKKQSILARVMSSKDKKKKNSSKDEKSSKFPSHYLFAAVKAGDESKVKAIFENNQSIDFGSLRNDDAKSLLEIAKEKKPKSLEKYIKKILHQQQEIQKLFLSIEKGEIGLLYDFANSDLDLSKVRNFKNKSLFDVAMEKNNKDIIRFLIQLNIVKEDFFYAIVAENIEKVKQYVELAKEVGMADYLLEARNDNNETPLMCALNAGKSNVIPAYLAKQGGEADDGFLDVMLSRAFTLWEASNEESHLDRMEFLLSRGADKDIIKFLFQQNENAVKENFFYAIVASDTQKVKKCVEIAKKVGVAGYLLEARNDNNETPLMSALNAGTSNVIPGYLVQQGGEADADFLKMMLSKAFTLWEASKKMKMKKDEKIHFARMEFLNSSLNADVEVPTSRGVRPYMMVSDVIMEEKFLISKLTPTTDQ